MRISDWSSDVCSSDLSLAAAVHGGATRRESVLAGLEAIAASGGADVVLIHDAARPFIPGEVVARLLQALRASDGAIPVLPVVDTIIRDGVNIDRAGMMRVQTPQAFRSEEHTSELQSLMRISYAVFCLKKKTKKR